MIRILCFAFTILMSFQLFAANTKGQYIQPTKFIPKVRIDTSMGSIVIQLDRQQSQNYRG